MRTGLLAIGLFVGVWKAVTFDPNLSIKIVPPPEPIVVQHNVNVPNLPSVDVGLAVTGLPDLRDLQIPNEIKVSVDGNGAIRLEQE